jgi:FkbM family methyltransferase
MSIKSLLARAIGVHNARKLSRWLHPHSFSETDLISRHLLAAIPDGVMIDVGAHHGESFDPYLAAGWKVYAFEPDTKNRSRIAGDYKSANLRLSPKALSDHEAENVTFYSSNQSTGISGLSAFHKSHFPSGQVALTTLARVIAGENISQVDFLKIDTEGHDLEVLRGAPWSRLSPKVILCEFEDAKTKPLGYDFQEMAGFLIGHGYRVWLSEWEPTVQYGSRHQWRSLQSFPCKLANPSGWGNLIAVHSQAALPSLVNQLEIIGAGKTIKK